MFENLARQYYKSLYHYAWSLTKSPDEAADLVQDTFIIFATKGHSIRDFNKIKSWLFTTLYRQFIKSYRRSRKMIASDPQLLEEIHESSTTTPREQADAQHALLCLEKLDSKHQEVLRLFYLKQLSYKEIAEVLSVPIGTVMSRISRGKKMLKHIFLNGEISS